MVGKKDTVMIFERYQNILIEQNQNNIGYITNQIKNSNLNPEVKEQILSLLEDPEVASKILSGMDADTVNAGDSNFARDMAAAQKAQNLAYPEQNEEEHSYDQDEQAVDCSTLTDPREKSNCIARRNMTIQQSMSNAGKGEAPPQRVAYGRSY
jgi:hypothetical protein